MANLLQIENSLAYYQGWYGTYPESGSDECESFPLIGGDVSEPTSLTKAYPEILNVFEIRADAKAQVSYIGTLPDGPFLGTQAIKELKCGHSYRIILKQGNNTSDPLSIPEFTYTHAGTTNYEYKIRSTI